MATRTGGGVKVALKGTQDVIRSLNALKRTLRSKIIRKAVTKAVQPIVKDAKARVPVRYKILKRSLGYRIKTYRRDGVVVGIVGPRRGFRTQVGVRKDGTPVFANPTRYAHLVEFGTVYATARPFMRPAWSAGRVQATQTMIAVMRAEIAAVLAKNRVKSP